MMSITANILNIPAIFFSGLKRRNAKKINIGF
jgi:hypothetical protein